MTAGSRPPQQRHVLCVDLGTGGPKVGLVSMAGELAWQEHTRIETRHLPDGGAVQDPDRWWHAVSSSARRALGSGLVPADQVEAVCCTGQWGSTVPVDRSGAVVGECLLWMDGRGERYSSAVVGGPVSGYDPRKLWAFVRKTGGVPSPLGKDPLGHALYLRNERPDVYAAAALLLEPIDFLGLRFTGRAVASPATMVLSWLTDNRAGGTPSYDPELVRLSTRDADRLPPLVPTASVVGTVLPEVAADLGLPPGVRVVAGVPDLHTATFGSGAVRDYEAHLSISTTSWIGCHVPFKRTDPVRQIASVPAAVPGRWVIANNHETAGLCLEWLQHGVIGADDGLTPGSGEPPLGELDALAERVAPGSGGVLFAPWLAGERCPVDDRTLRGSFHNLSLSTTRADLVRAVLEGVALNARWMLGAVERFLKRPADPLRFLGGGARSDLWCRIHADVLGRRVERVADPLTGSLRGAGLLAGVSLGAIRLDDVRALVPVDATFAPDPANRAVYDDLYAEFPGLYRAQKKMYARLNGRRS